MAFEIQITEAAFSDLDAIAAFIKEKASLDLARKWFAGILATIETLGEMPSVVRQHPRRKNLELRCAFSSTASDTARTKSTIGFVLDHHQPWMRCRCFMFAIGLENH